MNNSRRKKKYMTTNIVCDKINATTNGCVFFALLENQLKSNSFEHLTKADTDTNRVAFANEKKAIADGHRKTLICRRG